MFQSRAKAGVPPPRPAPTKRPSTAGKKEKEKEKEKSKEEKEEKKAPAAVGPLFKETKILTDISKVDLEQLCDTFLLASKSGDDSAALAGRLAEIRKAVLFTGIQDDRKKNLRGRVWKIMLGLDKVDADGYMRLIQRKESSKYSKIRSDSFRTFAGDSEFLSTVKEPEIIRLLNAFVLKYDATSFTYCQGMNTICGPFLYTMSEVDAFYSFCKFVTQKFPLYWVSAHIGVQAGCELVDQCLKVVDTELASHLEKYNLHAYLYAFACISSLCASVPPFSELLKLWDFLVTFGPHFNVLCVVAQIISLRDQLLKSESPKSILDPRKWPALRARFIISVAMSLVPQLPADLYERICLHATNPDVAADIVKRKVEGYRAAPAGTD